MAEPITDEKLAELTKALVSVEFNSDDPEIAGTAGRAAEAIVLFVARLTAEREAREKAEWQRDEWRRDFNTAIKYVIGETGLTFHQAVDQLRDRLTAAEAEAARLREAQAELLVTAKLLLENSEGCAQNHYGHDYATLGRPGWLADCAASIAKATALAPSRPNTEQEG